MRVVHRRSVELGQDCRASSKPTSALNPPEPQAFSSARARPVVQLPSQPAPSKHRSRRRLPRSSARPCRAIERPSCPPTYRSRNCAGLCRVRCPAERCAPPVGHLVRAYVEHCSRWRLNQAPHEFVTPEQSRPNHPTPHRGTRALPNPSLERTSTGRAPWPRGAKEYHAPRGQGALPAAAAQLKR